MQSILPPSAALCCHPVQRNAATLDDHQRACKISSTPKAGGGETAVRSGRDRSQALESKVLFADNALSIGLRQALNHARQGKLLHVTCFKAGDPLASRVIQFEALSADLPTVHLGKNLQEAGYWGATEQKTRLRIQAISTIGSDGL